MPIVTIVQQFVQAQPFLALAIAFAFCFFMAGFITAPWR
jgi:hypothetical protein